MDSEQPLAKKLIGGVESRSRGTWGIYFVAALPIAVVLGGLIYAIAVTPSRSKSFAVSGQVLDAETNGPITGARVVINVVNDAIIGTSQKYYGTVTDENGEFRVAGEAPWLVHYISVEASTPADLYAGAFDIHGHVVLKPQPLPPR